MRTLFFLFCLFLVAMIGCHNEQPADTTSSLIERPGPKMGPVEARIFKTNVAEGLILELTPHFKLLTGKLRGEPVDLSEMFLNQIKYSGPLKFDLQQATADQTVNQDQLVAHLTWPLMDEAAATEISPREIWEPILSNFQIEDSQFGVVSGTLLEDADAFHMKTKFEGRILDDQQNVYGVKAKQTLIWYPTVDGQWKIGNWKQEKLEVNFTSKFLFENVTDKAIPEEKLLETLSRSQHQEIIVARTKNRSVLNIADLRYPYFSDWQSIQQFPSVSVVDLDQDQWDDLFITDRWGESILLRNRGDQTFEDVSESMGLNLPESAANCALFADFDNDGDADVFIGRNVEPSQYYRNDGGIFVPDPEINKMLSDVKFVTSGSVVDINRDGLLDVYLTTYCFTAHVHPSFWIRHVVREEDRMKFQLRLKRGHQVINRGGPPNILLMNRGGRLERVDIADNLEQWKNSFQSIWTDADDDGDPDLYVCHDWAADDFLRNDTEPGSFEPKFTSFSDDVFPSDNMAFGMGASVGDYNSDGRLDFYISNMYSKAAYRVFQQIGGDIDPRIVSSAAGNFLFENFGGRYQQVAGLEAGDQHVSKVGWSFGGQLADFNNDGKHDIYVPSGFYTAPGSVDAQVDL